LHTWLTVKGEIWFWEKHNEFFSPQIYIQFTKMEFGRNSASYGWFGWLDFYYENPVCKHKSIGE
jgi:hypothetical protein